MSLQDNTQWVLLELEMLIGEVKDFIESVSQTINWFGHVSITSANIQLPNNNGNSANTPEAIIIRWLDLMLFFIAHFE